MGKCTKCGANFIGTAANIPKDQLCRYCQIDICKRGLIAVKMLIDESDGVVGLHLNGEVAPWHDLRTGGSFGEWLKDFDTALATIGVFELL